MPTESSQKAPRKPTARSRVSNGSRLGEGIDGRTVWARRLRDVLEDYTDDLMLPRDQIPNSIKSMIRRAAVLTVELERAEAGFAENGKADASALNEYQRTANSLRRLLESLNIKSEGPSRPSNAMAMRRVQSGFSRADWRLCDPDPKTADRMRARAIAFKLYVAERDGTPLAPQLAAFKQRLEDAQLQAEAEELEAELDALKAEFEAEEITLDDQ